MVETAVSLTKETNSSSKVSIFKVGSNNRSFSNVSTFEISTNHLSPIQKSVSQISTSQVSTTQVSPQQFSSSQISISQVDSSKIKSRQTDINELLFPSSNTFEKFFSTHSGGEKSVDKLNISSIKSSVKLPSFLYPSSIFIHTASPTLTNTFKDNPLNLTLQVTDLPNGQLAEAQVTHYTDQGIPKVGTILIDHNANGLGWFIDPTPLDHSEFSQTLADTALLATADSEAYGKYDLLTAILHEMGHLAGFISGYNEFDRHIQTINGKKTLVGDDFSATLTPDGSHLDPTAHPYDLLNNTLKPGIRKLPSLLDLQILNALSGSEGVSERESEGALTAPLTSAPLLGINNGTFDTQENWSTRGAANIIDGLAVLTEESRLNSNFTQDFIIPDQAKYLQFTILESSLTPSLAPSLTPNDAFEVALLNTNTRTPLAGITNEFTQTDALLNIQHNGNTYFSNKVKLSGAPTSGSSINLNSPRTVTIDIRDIAPNTEATIYFDLLGFGSKESKVIIDNVRILTSDILIPVANNDRITTTQGQPVIINVLDNDSDADGTINPSTLQIEAAPTNGTITINDNNTITYTPNSNQPGADTFTYTVQDNEGNTSNTATVNITINNTAPSINQITVEPTINEGIAATFTDPGILDTHTIEWDFGDGNTVTDVLEPSHNYSQNGTYTVKLTVTDSDGAATIDTLTVTVNNAAPVITEIIGDTNINEGDTANFSATATDPGNDTLTYSWDFGDGSDPRLGNNVTHKYDNNGTYTATLTVTDSDGASTTQTRTVQVNNVAPIIGTITGNTTVKKGETANFSVTATDPGNDTLTYTWNFGDGSQIKTGETVNHVFAQTGEFTVILTVTDSDGASTQRTFAVQAIPAAPKYAIRSEKQVRINNGGDLDGNPLDLNDDASIYAAKGFTINGDITLPAKQDENGNPLRNSSGKLILVDNAVTVAPNYTTINANNNKYANLVPPQVVEQQVVDIPIYADLKQQKLDSVIPSGTQTVTFNSGQNPLNNSQDWNNKFPAPSPASNPRVVRVTGGGLNIPDNINISNYVITVENGDINFNGSNHNFNNVVLISNNGNINLSGVRATNLSVFASGSINMNSQARFAASTLLASGSNNGSINFNGAMTSINSGDNLKVVSAGRITFNAASNSRGSMSSVGDFTFNNNSTLYGTIAAKGNVTFNNGANVVYTQL